MISRDEAINLVHEKIQNVNLRRHMLATEAVMRALAARLEEDEELWALTGLLHDIDLETVEQDPKRHAQVAAEWLEGKLPDEALQAIRAHNGEALGIQRKEHFEHALAASETLTGLVVATTLVLPSKKLADLKAKSVRKRMEEPRFAAAVSREIIRESEKLGLELAEFIDLGVEAMRKIGSDLGL
ncbi:MAG: HDIG domain-containing protein [Deltaproteobacteria bacterium]|nr:HDIG domain-containing protein [Deltaproteobacteria bacterium]MBW1873432.1 HDIG domain-containing protein [Deltaproteobacteria bacterium]